MVDSTETEINQNDDPTGDVFDVDTYLNSDNDGERPGTKAKKEPPPYQMYPESKIPVSKAFGSLWRTKIEATQRTNELIYEAWEQCFAYYNNHQVKAAQSTKGIFTRGDVTENVVYSNINVMLPAVYGQDPDVAINTTDKEDEPFAECAHELLNALLKGKNLLNAKPKIKKAVGVALMTNFGVIKLDYVLKSDSVDTVMNELQRVTKEIATAKNMKALENAYGKLAAIESIVSVFEPGGPKLRNVMARNLVVDPVAEMPDGTDASWMAERCYIQTSYLKYKFTQQEKNENDWYYVFKPTHKAVFAEGSGNQKDDAYGLVLQTLSGDPTYQENELIGTYRDLYFTECWLVWDKATRRTALFAADDWAYPLWVWDNYTKTSRFFPYFIFGFGLSTGQVTTVGEVSYYLDQQDEINQINRQVARIRNSIFNFFFYNSHKISQADVEILMKALKRGFVDEQAVVGVKVPEGGKISDVIEAVVPPAIHIKELFNKEPTMQAIDRISNTSDAIRGTQFKTNTNEASVQSYQDAARMSVGAKIEVVEEVMADLCKALLEQCVQNMDKEDVIGLIGPSFGEAWQNMTLQQFNSNYGLDIVPGTVEKPNSIFKKKEAVQIVQAIGQFASAAPVTSMKVALRVLEQAFTEVVIKPEDWNMMEQEMTMNAQKGNSTGAPGAPQPGAPPGGPPGGSRAPPPGGASSGPPSGAAGGAPQPAPGTQPPNPAGGAIGTDIPPALANLPPQVKNQVMQMHAQGMPAEQIMQYIQQQVQNTASGAGPMGPVPVGGKHLKPGAPAAPGAPPGTPIQ
jgi:hypothetical protein